MTIRNCLEKKIKSLKSNKKNKDKVEVDVSNFTFLHGCFSRF